MSFPNQCDEMKYPVNITNSNDKQKCPKCKLLEQVFPVGSMKTNYDYWLMTEVFVFLHDGKDYCDKDKE